jgi:four helix bundle protein
MPRKESILKLKTEAFAVRITKLYKYLVGQKESVITKQIYRSGTSIGANIHEGIFAQSKPDFISKLGIALKEAGETSYWLKLLYRTDYLDQKLFSSLHEDCEELIKILTATIKSSKENQ